MQKKIRVVFVGAFLSPAESKVTGGVQFECRSLVKSPISDRIEWLLIDSTMESIPPPRLTRRIFKAGLRVCKFMRFLVFFRPDCCLIYSSGGASFFEKGLMVLIARIMNVPRILRPVDGSAIDNFRNGKFWPQWMRFVARSTTLIACQGVNWQKFYISVGDLQIKRVPIVYNPLATDLYSTVPSVHTASSQKALLLGWVDRNKGIWDLLEAIRIHEAEMEGMKFIICGDGVELEAFNKMVSKIGFMRFFEFRGWIGFEEKIRVFSECSVYLMLSHREGLPNALLEGMASGRAIVATNVGSVSDFIENEETGLLCNPGDANGIGKCIIRLRNSADLRSRLGAAAKQKVKLKVDSNLVWRVWEEVITQASSNLFGNSAAKN